MSASDRPITIKDVARLAGVGISTVSRALNGSGPVSAETRQRILQIAGDLGYRPNAIAQSMVTRSTGTLGLVIPDLRNPYFPSLARGVEDAAARHGYTVMLGNSDNDPSREWTYVRALLDRQVDGIILTGTATDMVLIRQILQTGTPVVSPDHGLQEILDVVRFDQVASARAATQHLIDMGHRRIAHIAAPSWTRTGRERLTGYREAISTAGLSLASALIRVGDWQMESGRQALLEMWREGVHPTAIYAANDLMAIGAISALTELGVRIPDDVAVLGHGNVPFAAMINPPLSSVAEKEYQWGEKAVELIVERATHSYEGPARNIMLPYHIVIRQSCGATQKGVLTC